MRRHVVILSPYYGTFNLRKEPNMFVSYQIQPQSMYNLRRIYGRGEQRLQSSQSRHRSSIGSKAWIRFKVTVKKMASSLENLETQLEMFIENVRQIRIIVGDFQPQGQNVLNQKIQSLVHGLQEIDKLKSQVQEVHVPLEVFDYIDQGRNPQLYTKDCIEKALTKNEQVKGKIDAYRKFKAHLLVELNSVFPNELTKYRAIRGDERPLT